MSDQRSRAFLSEITDMPGDARAQLLGEDWTPRILFHGEWAFGVLPDFERQLDGRITGTGRLRFAFDGKRFITARRHALKVADEMHSESRPRRPSSPIPWQPSWPSTSSISRRWRTCWKKSPTPWTMSRTACRPNTTISKA